MVAPTVYRWDDDQAPVLYGADGSLTKLLKTVLVDGYGSQAGAGWTCPYESTDPDETVKALRSDPVTGTGMYYRVAHPDPASTAMVARVTGYEAMTDIDNGVNMWPAQILTLDHAWYRVANAANDNIPRPWCIIADSRAFYIWVWYFPPDYSTSNYGWNHGGEGVSAMFIGDFISDVPGDGYAAAIIASYASGYRSRLGECGITSNSTYQQGMFVPRFSTGLLPTAGESCRFAMVHSGPCRDVSGHNNAGIAHPWHGRTLFGRPYINDGESYSYRGYLPGFYATPHSTPFDNFDTFTDGEGIEYTALWTFGYSYKGQIFMDLGEGWRP